MVVGQVVVVGDQSIRIRIGLDGLAEGIGDFQGVVGECGDKRAVVDNEGLAFRIICQPVEEILGRLLLLRRGVLGGVDEEVLGAAADELLVGAVAAVVGNGHHAHVLAVVIGIDDGPVPVAAEHEGDLALCQLLLSHFALRGDGGILCVVVLAKDIKGIHHIVEFLVFDQLDGAVLDAGDEGVGIVVLLIDLGDEVAGQGPVFLHDTDRALHTALLALLDDGLEIIGGLDGGGVKVLAGRVLDGVGIVDDAAGLDADREAIDLAVNGDGLCGVCHPVLVAEVKRVLSCQRIDVLGVDHGNGVGLV